MTQTVKHHPSLNILEQFADGRLTAEIALVVSAHLDYCPHCQQLCRDMEADFAGDLVSSPMTLAPSTSASQMPDKLSRIMAMPVLDEEKPASSASHLEFGGQLFKLPHSVRRLSEQRSKWLTLGGIASCRLPSGEPHHLSLLVIGEKTEVPRHTHKGLEMTLVLAGEIEDENGRYVAGDLIVASSSHTHTPRNVQTEPCLCLSVLSAPLEFTQGMTRLLNPFQRFFY